MSIAVIGSLSRDLPAGGPARVGGTPYYTACALRFLGARATIVTKCAERDRDLLLRPTVALGVPVTWRRAGTTASFAYEYVDEVRRMTVEAIGEPWTPDDARGWVAEAIGKTRWLHLAPLLRSDFPAETVRRLARGRWVLLDGQGLVRPNSTGPLELDADFDPEILRHVAILKLAEEEALTLVESIDERLLGRLGVGEIIVTHGIRGASVLVDGQLRRVAAHPIEHVDPTGSGDAFAVTYLCARHSGAAPLAAARRATALVGHLLAGRRP